MKRNIHLLLVDPQNDFCDLPAAYKAIDPLTGKPCEPALPVPGAHADLQRIAELIVRGGQGLSGISVTLDSHHRVDIAHPTFWVRADGSPVSPFTAIRAADVREGRFLPRQSGALARVLGYLDALEASGRYHLMAWPVHCEIGSWGHNVHVDVRAAYNRWEELTTGIVDKIIKGTNPWTEHYSAVMAEVPDPGDAATQLNHALIATLRQADLVYIAGEAGSHCVRATTEHLASHLAPDQLAKLVLLIDAMSPVAGFEAQQAAFLAAMTARGLSTATTTDVLPELAANAGR